MSNMDVVQSFNTFQSLLMPITVGFATVVFGLILAVKQIRKTTFGRWVRSIERKSPVKIKDIRDVSLGLISLAFGFSSQPQSLKVMSFVVAMLVFGLFFARFVQRSIDRPRFLWLFPVPFFALASLGFYFGSFEYPNASLKILLISIGVSFGFLGLFVTVMLMSSLFQKKDNSGEDEKKKGESEQ